MKRKPLLKRTGLQRKVELKRTPWRRRRSKKMADRYAGVDGRAAFVARLLKERPICEAGGIIATAMPIDKTRELRARTVEKDGIELAAIVIWHECRRKSEHVHEILARSAGGDILDEQNAMAVCFNCHWWIGKEPRQARRLGLRKSRYNR